jgi:hypothetical protein
VLLMVLGVSHHSTRLFSLAVAEGSPCESSSSRFLCACRSRA